MIFGTAPHLIISTLLFVLFSRLYIKEDHSRMDQRIKKLSKYLLINSSAQSLDLIVDAAVAQYNEHVSKHRDRDRDVPSSRHEEVELYRLMKLPRYWPRHSISQEDTYESSLQTCEVNLKNLMDYTSLASETAITAIVTAALVCASRDLDHIFKFTIYPEHSICGYREDLTLVLHTCVPICNIEVKKKISSNVHLVDKKHLQQMFLYAYYFMTHFSLTIFHSILTDLKQWYGYTVELNGEVTLMKVTKKCIIATNHDLYTFLN